VNENIWFEDEDLYADIVLPVKTTFECDVDFNVDSGNGQFYLACWQTQTVTPIGESLSDTEIVAKVADALGVLDQYNNGLTHEQLAEDGFNLSGIQNYISLSDFQTKKYFMVPCDPKWATYPVGFSSYYQMSEGSGLDTVSGKIEFFSQNIFQNFPNDQERPPVPHYIPYGPSHQESLVTARAQTYPLLAVTAHPRWRVHSQHDDMAWTREILTCKVRGPDGYQYEPIWINPTDAAARGIKTGDIVQMFNDRGIVLGGAYVTERVMAGSVWSDHGAREDPINDDISNGALGIDRGGSNNMITTWTTMSQNCSGLVGSGYLVQVAKADMASLQAQYPAAFARPFDPASGPIPAQTLVTTTSSSAPSEAKA
jgi:trimethylamine-N-oxide reductase (cytochrome c)